MAKGDVKAKYWVGVFYPENMPDDWRDTFGDVVGLPYAFCVHDKDTLAKYVPKADEEEYKRKVHGHAILAFPNPTTYSNALRIFQSLSAPGKQCVNRIEPVNNIRHKYEYLIHNTETAKKQGKYVYDVSERITGNNFDIGLYEQVSLDDKNRMAKELCDLIVKEKWVNFVDFYKYVVDHYDMTYFDVMKSYSGMFERLTKGNWQKQKAKEEISLRDEVKREKDLEAKRKAERDADQA